MFNMLARLSQLVFKMLQVELVVYSMSTLLMLVLLNLLHGGAQMEFTRILLNPLLYLMLQETLFK